MKCVYGILIFFLTFVALKCSSAAVIEIVKDEDNVFEREKRQMKNETPIAQPDGKSYGPEFANPGIPVATAANIPFGRITTLMYPVGYPGFLGSATNLQGVNTAVPTTNIPLTNFPSGNYPSNSGLTYPTNMELMSPFMYNGLYPAGTQNTAGFGNQLGFNPSAAHMQNAQNLPGISGLDNLINYANMQGLNPQLNTQQGVVPLTQGYPLIPGFIPQLNYGAAFQSYQG